MRRKAEGEWPEQGVTFAVRRGSFTIPLDVLELADETGDDDDVRRRYAEALPKGARIGRHEKTHDGLMRIYWRTILVVERDYPSALSAASARPRPISR